MYLYHVSARLDGYSEPEHREYYNRGKIVFSVELSRNHKATRYYEEIIIVVHGNTTTV